MFKTKKTNVCNIKYEEVKDQYAVKHKLYSFFLVWTPAPSKLWLHPWLALIISPGSFIGSFVRCLALILYAANADFVLCTRQKDSSRGVLQISKTNNKLIKITVIFLKNSCKISQFWQNFRLLPLIKLQPLSEVEIISNKASVV